MRRTVLALTTMFAALILGTGIAVAEGISGTQGNDNLRGTLRGDQIYGLNGNDNLYGFAGSDELYGGAGRDNLYAGPGVDRIYGGSGDDRVFGSDGRDFINTVGGGIDIVDCGNPDGARDRVVRDSFDPIRNCNEGEVQEPAE